MNKALHIFFLVFVFCAATDVSGQCPTATIPDTVCAGEPFDIINTTPGFESYYWDFCTGDLNNIPVGTNQGNIGGLFNSAHQVDIVEDSGNFYGFIANFGNNNIVRLDFGNSPGNIPTAVALTVNSLNGPTGIQMLKEGTNWYALVQNYFSSQLIKFDFGNSITNISPTDNNLGQFSLSTPFHLKLIQQNNNIYLFSSNFSGNNVIRLDFGNSINNTPVATTISDASFVSPFGIDIVYDCALDKFIGAVTNMNGASLSILDFGNNLQNIPIVTSFNSLSITSPTAVNILKDSLNWHVLITDETGNFTQVNFEDSLLNINPTVLYNGALGSLSTPRGMEFINFESIWYGNIINWGGSLTQVAYPETCTLSPKFSDIINPSGLTFNADGNHLFHLAAKNTDGLIYHYTKNLTILEAPIAEFGILNSTCSNIFEFQDSSSTSIGSITDWLWDFGDGNNSNQQNPVHAYSSPGNYTVNLTITNSFGCTSSLSTIIDNSQPVASFTVTDGCIVPPLEFINTSPDTQNVITSFFWDFGDGNISTLENPQHIYLNPGIYSVTFVASIGSCSDTVFDTINYQPKPDVQFSVVNTCFSQQQQFNNYTTIASGTIISYDWDFGDGNFSSSIQPVHQYSDTGNYSVSLIAVGNNGCSDTLIQVIRISLLPSADFNIQTSTLCSGTPIVFQDNSIAIGDTLNSWLWKFGDGDSAFSANPSHVYDSAGIYNVTLFVTAGTSCIDSISQIVIIEESPNVSFTSSNACLGDSTEFTDLSSTSSGNIVSWTWTFNNGDTSNLQNPDYLFQTSGIFPVSLEVISDIGCSASDTMMITVSPLPVVNFVVENKCSSKETKFIDSSSVSTGNIISWSWDFGDPGSGSGNISSLQNPTHIYNFPGVYQVFLEIETSDGCKGNIIDSITVVKTPYANFSSTQACDGEHVSFTYLDNTFPSNATNWYWDFGNGATSTIEDPATLYLTWGTYQVTLIVGDSVSGCSDTIIKPVDIDPIPVPVILNNRPCVGYPYVFEDSSFVATGTIVEWEWLINSNVYTLQNPIYTFQDTGDYIVSLNIITDAGCTASVTDTIKVSNLPHPDFSFSPTFGDAPLTINFLNNSIGAQSYLWDFGDGNTSISAAPDHIYTDTGTFNIMLVAVNEHGCSDSLLKTIYVIQPRLDVAVINLFPSVNNNFISLSVEILNVGTREVNYFDISAKLGNNQSIQESWSGILKSGEAIIYSFNAAIEMTNEATFVCSRVNSPNGLPDDNQNNNEKCISLENDFQVLSLYPNPSYDIITIQYNMTSANNILIELYDNAGKLVRKLFEGEAEKGYNSFSFSSESENISNGTYTIKLLSGDKVISEKIVKN